MEEGKRCTKCGEIKEVGEFHRNKKVKSGLTSRCKLCSNEICREYHEKNKDSCYEQTKKWREENRFFYVLAQSRRAAKKWGGQPCIATAEELEAAFMGKCEVCGVPELELTRKLQMDHSHLTGEFRGWLCHNCNVALGMLKDSREVILNLLLYAQRHENQISIKKGQ